jgi:hypothetical protein
MAAKLQNAPSPTVFENRIIVTISERQKIVEYTPSGVFSLTPSQNRLPLHLTVKYPMLAQTTWFC